jgi:hypothetical protein
MMDDILTRLADLSFGQLVCLILVVFFALAMVVAAFRGGRP